MPKKLKGDPLVSLGIVCYAEKLPSAENVTEKMLPFWFSSLGQMIQFGTIKFRRTFKNYFGQFVWIEKIVAFHFMKRRLKVDVLLRAPYCGDFCHWGLMDIAVPCFFRFFFEL